MPDILREILAEEERRKILVSFESQIEAAIEQGQRDGEALEQYRLPRYHLYRERRCS